MRRNERGIALLYDRFTTAPVNRIGAIDFVSFLVPLSLYLFVNVELAVPLLFRSEVRDQNHCSAPIS